MKRKLTFSLIVCMALSLLSVTAQNAPAVGDYFYQDGTWSSKLEAGKTCIGIVFATGAKAGDKVENYGKSFAGKSIKGYVMALQNTSNYGKAPFYTTETAQKYEAGKPDWNSYNGYEMTRKLVKAEHFKAATNDYRTIKNLNKWAKANAVPANTSGWYIPSPAQLWDFVNGCCSATDKDAKLSKAYTEKSQPFSNGGHFLFTSNLNANAVPVGVLVTKDGSKIAKKANLKATERGVVRAVLTIIG